MVTDPVSLADQIACVRRELAMRASVYPHRIRSGKMTALDADLETRRMQAVLDTLERVGRLNAEIEVIGEPTLIHALHRKDRARRMLEQVQAAGGRGQEFNHYKATHAFLGDVCTILNALMPPPADEPA